MLNSREIKPVNLKEDQPWIFTGKTDTEAETPVFWSSDVDRWLNCPRKDWGQKEKRASEDEVAGQHHRCNEHELVQTLGDGEGQGGLACRRPWGRKELDTTGQWNNFLKEMGTIPHYLPPEKRVCKSRSNSWNWTWNNRLVQNWKRSICQGYVWSPCLFNLHAEYITQNARLDEAQAGVKIARRNINNLRYADDMT